MQVELGKVVNSVEVIRKLTQQELPVKLGFRLLSLTKDLDEKLKAFEESRIALIKKYGEETDGNIQVTQENIEAFSKDLNDLLTEEIQVNVPAISIDSFPETLSLSVAELSQIEWLIVS